MLMVREEDAGSSSSAGEARHRMAAACVVFSFAGLPAKLSAPLGALHVPVPAFQEELLKLVNRTFDGLDPTKPLWRNNWGERMSGMVHENVSLSLWHNNWSGRVARWVWYMKKTWRRRCCCCVGCVMCS